MTNSLDQLETTPVVPSIEGVDQTSAPISAAEAAQLRDRQKSQMKLLSQLNASLLSLKAEVAVIPSLKSLVDQLNSQLKETTRTVNEQKHKIRELQLEIQGGKS